MMLGLVYAGVIGTILAVDVPPAPPADVKQSYEEAKAKVGRSSEEQVKLALWCESHGLTTQKLHHLTLAVLADPKNAAARGLMGLVAYNGRWLRPEVVADKAKVDPILAEYQDKRQKAPYTADAQWALGVWADEHGLKEQAKAHLTAVIRLDPKRDLAWKKLGFKKHDGRWITDAQLAAEKAEIEAQKTADRKWKPLFEKYKAMLDQPSKREEAESALAEVTDPRAVPMIGQVFAKTEATQPRAVQLLGQIDSASASKALGFLAIFAKSADARRMATETLRGRDPREYANLLIAMIRKPIKYEVKPVGGPGSPGELFIEGEKTNVKRLYSSVSGLQAGDTIGVDRFGQPVVRRVLDSFARSAWGNPFNPNVLYGLSSSYEDNFSSYSIGIGNLARYHQNSISPAQFDALKSGHFVAGSGGSAPITPDSYGSFSSIGGSAKNPRDLAWMLQAEVPLDQVIAESQRSALNSQQQLSSDVAILDATNKSVGELNDRAVGILNNATGQNLPPDPTTWQKWWVNVLGYAFVTGQTTTNPTFVDVVPSDYVPQLIPSNVIYSTLAVNGLSCFGAGTPIKTVDGTRPIESLKVGDLVLSQNINSGALSYKPILVVHHNPPSATFKIKLSGDSIISSHFHRFWVAGRGWVMARDLKAGDPVRTLGGVVPVESVEADKVQLVYNLDIAEDADFFAGNAGALVHDNTLPDPRLVPFDASPKAGPIAGAGKSIE